MQTVFKESPLTLLTGKGNLISVSDVDVESDNLQVYLGVSHGTLTQSGTSNIDLIAFDVAAHCAARAAFQ
jgi:hypothetical protein